MKEFPTEEDIKKARLLDEYCKKDAILPKGLFTRFNLRNKYAGGSRANMLNVENQLWSGQQIRVWLNMDIEMRNMKSYDKIFLAPFNEPMRDRKKDADEDEDEDDLLWDDRYDSLLETVDFDPTPDGELFKELYEKLSMKHKIYNIELKRDAEKIKKEYIQQLYKYHSSSSLKDEDGDDIIVDDNTLSFEQINNNYNEQLRIFTSNYNILSKNKQISDKLLEETIQSLKEYKKNTFKINNLALLKQKDEQHIKQYFEYETRIKQIHDSCRIRLLIEAARIRRIYVRLYELQNNVSLTFKHDDYQLLDSEELITSGVVENKPIKENTTILDDELIAAYLDEQNIYNYDINEGAVEEEAEHKNNNDDGYDSDEDYVPVTNEEFEQTRTTTTDASEKDTKIKGVPSKKTKKKDTLDQEKEEKEEMNNDNIEISNNKAERIRKKLYNVADEEGKYKLTNSKSLLCKARFVAEGVAIYNEFDEMKSYKMLKKHCKSRCKFAVRAKKKKDVGYEGATVLEAFQSFYTDPVSTLDFNSLYPNIMRSVNMSHETKVSAEDIKKFGYKEGEDYRTVVMGRVTKDYKFPLCQACTEGLAKDRAAGIVGFKCCEDEKELKKTDIKKNNWRENDYTRPTGQYVRILMEERKVSFIKKMCEECFTCKDCDLTREHGKGLKQFCTKHEICPHVTEMNKHIDAYMKSIMPSYNAATNTVIPKPENEIQQKLYDLIEKEKAIKCPQYRKKAVLCEVITRLLDARTAAKDEMGKWADAASEHYSQYLKICGLKAETSVKECPFPGSEKFEALWKEKNKTDEELQELLQVYEKWKKAKEMEGLFDQWQAAFKVTCNSVYGFTGAKQGFLPDIDIASAVTGEGRRMIYQTKESIQYTATPELNKFKTAPGQKQFKFWDTCDIKHVKPINWEKEEVAKTERTNKFNQDCEELKSKYKDKLKLLKREFYKKYESDKMVDENEEDFNETLASTWKKMKVEHKEEFQKDMDLFQAIFNKNEDAIKKKNEKAQKWADSNHHIVREPSGEVYLLVRFPKIKYSVKIHLTQEEVERSYRDSKVLYGMK